MNRHSHARLALLLVLPAVVAACGSPSHAAVTKSGAGTGIPTQNASLVLDWYPNSDHGGLYTAIQRGIFRRYHINMNAHVPSDTSAQIPLVAAGRADFGISYETDVLAARARNIPVKSVMCIMQHPLDTVMALTSSGITRPRQLQGKTVGMAGSPSDQPIVKAMVQHDGGDFSKVQMVNVGYNLLPVLLARRVDAVIGVYWTWEAIQARQSGHPVNVLRVEKWGVPNYCELVLVASDRTIRMRPAFVRDTVRAMQEGYAYAEAHPEAAWAALHTIDKTLRHSTVVTSLTLLQKAVTDTPTIGYQNAVQWRRYASWLEANKLISGPVDASTAFTDRFISPGIR